MRQTHTHKHTMCAAAEEAQAEEHWEWKGAGAGGDGVEVPMLTQCVCVFYWFSFFCRFDFTTNLNFAACGRSAACALRDMCLREVRRFRGTFLLLLNPGCRSGLFKYLRRRVSRGVF